MRWNEQRGDATMGLLSWLMGVLALLVVMAALFSEGQEREDVKRYAENAMQAGAADAARAKPAVTIAPGVYRWDGKTELVDASIALALKSDGRYTLSAKPHERRSLVKTQSGEWRIAGAALILRGTAGATAIFGGGFEVKEATAAGFTLFDGISSYRFDESAIFERAQAAKAETAAAIRAARGAKDAAEWATAFKVVFGVIGLLILAGLSVSLHARWKGRSVRTF